jgi:type I restriction enzyme S subunit
VRRADQYLQFGDILISSANSWNLVGKCSWIPELPWRTSFGGFVSVLRPDPEKIFPRFLFWWFSSTRIQALARSFGNKTTSISNLNIDRCLALSLTLPSLDEQKRIAGILDEVQALRDKRRDSICQLDDLAESVFFEMFGSPDTNSFGWERKLFGRLLSIPLRNGLSPSTDGTIEAKVLTLSAITGPEFAEHQWRYAGFNSVPPSNQSVDSRDFLICRGNGNRNLVGSGHFPDISAPDVTFPDTMIAARVNVSELSPLFLAFIWKHPFVRKQIDKAVRTTNGTYKVNQSILESVSIICPPLELQNGFSKKILSIQELKATYRDHLAQLNALFGSLQHRAFRGEL